MTTNRYYYIAEGALVKELLKVSQSSITNLAVFVQRGALEALKNPHVNEYCKEMREKFRIQKENIKKYMADNGIKFIEPNGAFYFLIDISETGLDSSRFSKYLLEEHGVVVVPGIAYGKSVDSYIRICFAVDSKILSKGIEKITKTIKSLK